MFSKKIALKQLNELKKRGGEMRLAANEWTSPWQTLVSIILSARTRDEVTIVVCEKMFRKYPTPQKFSKLTLKQIEKLIYSVNFFRNKSKNLLECTKKIMKEYKGKVPESFEELIELPGVGRKTANVYLAEFGEQTIGVDTHVNYISNYLGWVNSPNPKIVEEELKKLFPKNKLGKLNDTLVRFGKEYTSRKQKNEILDEIKKIK